VASNPSWIWDSPLSIQHKKFFHTLEEHVDFQKLSMKGWNKGCISQLVSTCDTTPIERAEFLCALKEAMLQYVKIEAKNAASNDDESLERRKAFLGRINYTIIQWRTYLAFVVDDGLLMNNTEVDEFVVMVERTRKIYSKREDKDTTKRKPKQGEEIRT
jgi:hypothetical protein